MYLSIRRGGKKSNAIKKLLNPFRGRGCYIKQAIQGLFTAGTSEKKEKVGGKRGLTPDIYRRECPNNPAGTN